MQRGEVHRPIVLLLFLVVLAYLFLSIPSPPETQTPTGLQIAGRETFAVLSSCPAVINESTTLTGALTSNDTCVTFNANSIELDCQGNSITWNIIGQNSVYAVYAENKTGITIKNCILIDGNASSNFTAGINFTQVNSSLIMNNTVRTNGSDSNYGMIIQNDSFNNNVQLNSIFVNATENNNNGLHLVNSAYNTTVANNTIRIQGGSNYAIRADHFTTISNNTIYTEDSSSAGAYVTDNSTIRNNTINTHGSSGTTGVLVSGIHVEVLNNILVLNGTTSSGHRAIVLDASRNVNITNNNITVIGSTSGNDGIDGSASSNLIIENNTILLNGSTPGYGMDFSSGPAQNYTIRNNNITANGSTTNIGISDQTTQATSDNHTIVANLIVANEGIVFASPGTTLANNTVNVTNGGSSEDGIEQTSNAVNSTIVGNNITINTSSGGMNGIRLAAGIALIANNTLRSSVYATGINLIGHFQGGSGTNITNNTFHIIGSSTTYNVINGGTSVQAGVERIVDNVVIANGTGTVTGFNIRSFGGGVNIDYILLAGNTFNITGGSASSAMKFDVSTTQFRNATIANNTFITNGPASHAVYLTGNSGSPSYGNNFTGNNITVNGENSSGFFLATDGAGTNSEFANNKITVNDPTGYGIWSNNGRNNNFTNNTLVSVGNWINLTSSGRGNNFTNTTFKTGNGTINFGGTIFINVTQDINGTGLNVSSNRTIVNVTNMTFFNTTARLTWYGLTFTDPRPLIDTEDTGSFTTCSDCTEISYSGGNYTIDVTHFTTYASQETPVAAASSSNNGGGGSASSAARSNAASTSTATAQTQAATATAVSVTQTMTTQTAVHSLSVSQAVAVSVNNEKHTVAVTSISTDSVTVTVQSKPQTFILKVGQSKLVDVNGDNIDDLRVELLGIGKNADLKITKLEPPAPVKVTVSEPAPEVSTEVFVPAPVQESPVQVTQSTNTIPLWHIAIPGALLVIILAVLAYHAIPKRPRSRF